MTVCVAVLFDKRKGIVQVSDHKVSFGAAFSADNRALKDVPFFADYVALVAGDDVEHASPILKRAAAILFSREPYDYSIAAVASAVDEAFGERIQQEISSKVLRKRGFTVETFADKGRQKCTPSAYLALCSRIDQVRLSLKFLICGFDDNQGHIWCVDGESAPKCYDDVGMWAIGSGAPAALSSLAFHSNRLDFGPFSDDAEAAYFAVASKFMAETSELVGEATFCVVRKKGEKPNYLDVQDIRNIWEEEGRPRCPSNLGARIGKVLRPVKAPPAGKQ